MLDEREYVDKVIEKLAPYANPEAAPAIEGYMKNQFKVLGLRAPQVQKATKDLFRELGLPDKKQLPSVVKDLWALPEREYQYVAVSILTKMAPDFVQEDISLLEYVITHKPWWDTIDAIAKNPVGDYFVKFPHLMESQVEEWVSSGNMWLARSAILCQLGWKQHTREDILFRVIEWCMDERYVDPKEFFIRKAIGWALREYSKTNPERVVEFVQTHPGLSGLSKREALKVVQRKS